MAQIQIQSPSIWHQFKSPYLIMAPTQMSIVAPIQKSTYLLWLQFKTPYLLWYQLKCQYSLYSNNWVPESQTSSAISAGTKWAQKYNYIPNKWVPESQTSSAICLELNGTQINYYLTNQSNGYLKWTQ